MKYKNLFEKLYGDTYMPVAILNENLCVIWHNDSFRSYLKEGNEADGAFDNAVKEGDCTLEVILGFSVLDFKITFCNDLDNIYIAEGISNKSVKDFMRDKNVSVCIDRANFIIREGISKLSSSLNLAYDCILCEELSQSIEVMNSAMNACYEMLRSVSVVSDAHKIANKQYEPNIVDFSMVADTFDKEISEITEVSILTLSSDIDAGVFVKADKSCLFSSIVTLLLLVANKNGGSFFCLTLKTVGDTAVLSIEPHKSPSASAADNATAEIDDTLARLAKFNLSEFTHDFGGSFFEYSDKQGYAAGIKIKLCEIRTLPFHSPVIHYKGDRFSKSRIYFSPAYKIRYFKAVRRLDDIQTAKQNAELARAAEEASGAVAEPVKKKRGRKKKSEIAPTAVTPAITATETKKVKSASARNTKSKTR